MFCHSIRSCTVLANSIPPTKKKLGKKDRIDGLDFFNFPITKLQQQQFQTNITATKQFNYILNNNKNKQDMEWVAFWWQSTISIWTPVSSVQLMGVK